MCCGQQRARGFIPLVLFAAFFALSSAKPPSSSSSSSPLFAKMLTDDPVEHLRMIAKLRKLLANEHQNQQHPRTRQTQSIPISLANGLSQQLKDDIDDFVAGIQQCSQVPGITFSLTSKNLTLHTSAAGNTSVDPTRATPIGNSTLFSIGSTTKAFTTTGLAILQDRGLVDWDDHTLLADKMPYLHINVTQWDWDLTLRDLTSHRTGIGRNDILSISYPNTTRQHLVAFTIPNLNPISKFRYTFIYNNYMYSAAGTFIDAVTSQSWEDFIESEIMHPIGMSRTQTRIPPAVQDKDYAAPHVRSNNASTPLPVDINVSITLVAPAGAIASSSLDMARWMRLQLNNGFSPDSNTRIVSEKSLGETHTPTMQIGGGLGLEPGYLPNEFDVDDVTSDYALGWILASYRGYKHIWHGGGTLGHTTIVALLPLLPNGDALGMFASMNQMAGAENLALQLLKYFVFDSVLGVSPPAINLSRACEIIKSQLNPQQETEDEQTTTTTTTTTTTARKHSHHKHDQQQHVRSTLTPSDASLGVLDFSGNYTNVAWGSLQVFSNNSILLNTLTGVLREAGKANSFAVHPTGVWELLFTDVSLFEFDFVLDQAQASVIGVMLVSPDGSYFFLRE